MMPIYFFRLHFSGTVRSAHSTNVSVRVCKVLVHAHFLHNRQQLLNVVQDDPAFRRQFVDILRDGHGVRQQDQNDEEHEDAGGTGHVKNSVVDLVSGERSAVVQSL